MDVSDGAAHGLDLTDKVAVITAWATGFMGMELAGAFRLGGDLDSAFEFGLSRLTAELQIVDSDSTPAKERT